MLKMLAVGALMSDGLTAAGAYAGDSLQVESESRRYEDIVQVPVEYADLNLESAAGAKVMLRRIEDAASEACGGKRMNNRVGTERWLWRDCVRAATADAVDDLDAPMVTALYAREAPSTYDLASASE